MKERKYDSFIAVGRDFGYGLISAASWTITICWIVVAAWTHFFPAAFDDSDLDKDTRSGVSIVTDYKTGLQYLATPNGGIVQRIGVDGSQIKIGFTNGK